MQDTRPMTRWEYKVYVTELGDGNELRKLGLDGWELVSCIKERIIHVPTYEMLFKRPISTNVCK